MEKLKATIEAYNNMFGEDHEYSWEGKVFTYILLVLSFFINKTKTNKALSISRLIVSIPLIVLSSIIIGRYFNEYKPMNINVKEDT